MVVNEDEAIRVRTIFELYLEYQSLIATIAELDRRGWLNKRWITRKGIDRGGRPFNKDSLHCPLTNVAYLGKLRYKHEINEGEHAAIVSAETWQRVQSLLGRNGRTGGTDVRNKFGALLKGILRCAPCGCAITPTHATKDGNKRYRYYVCSSAQKRGWHTCPSKSIPAGEIERFVVEQIKGIDHLVEHNPKHTILLVSGYNKPESEPTPEQSHLCDTRLICTPWGWGVDRKRLVWLMTNWCTRNPKCFTCNFRSQYQRTRKELFPVLSRIQNIGYELGENSRTAEWYRANH